MMMISALIQGLKSSQWETLLQLPESRMEREKNETASGNQNNDINEKKEMVR